MKIEHPQKAMRWSYLSLHRELASYEFTNSLAKFINSSLMTMPSSRQLTISCGNSWMDITDATAEEMKEIKNCISNTVGKNNVSQWSKKSTSYSLQIKGKVTLLLEESLFLKGDDYDDGQATVYITFRWGIPKSCKIKYKKERVFVRDAYVKKDGTIVQEKEVFDRVECDDKSILRNVPYFNVQSEIDRTESEEIIE